MTMPAGWSNDNNNVKLTRKQKKLIKKQNQLGEEQQKVAQKLQEEEQKQIQKREKAERAKDNAVIALLIIFIVSPVPAIVLGIQYHNWTAIIFGLVVLFALGILGGIYGGKKRHNNGYFYYGAASSAGRGFRMWAADRATRKRR
jgi:Flp pilus assembly protein TadB